jgi:hypothetical protein
MQNFMPNLNETRHIIRQLTQAMVKIAQEIEASKCAEEDDMEDLKRKKLMKSALEEKLILTKYSMEAVQLPSPRTVCSNPSCVEFQEDSFKMMSVVYKTVCHSPCHDNVGDALGCVSACAAFDAQGFCKCGHHYGEHLSQRYYMRSHFVRHEDQSVKEALKENVNSIRMQEMTIKNHQKKKNKLQRQLDQIQEAIVLFNPFMTSHSSTQ